MASAQTTVGPSIRREGAPQHTKVAIASLIGTAIEWYDFFLYNTAAALVFNRLFFPQFDPLVGTLLAFTTYSVGFIARPFGGVIFGHFGDRIGRKKMLYITLLFMGLSSTIIGLLPTYLQIGIWAPILLTLMRVCQGIGLGGEWGGAVVMAVEHAPEGRRGLWGSFPQTGLAVGGVMSAFAFWLVAGMPQAQLLSWGWRVPFLFSIVLVAIGIWVRMTVAESPAFQKIKDQKGEEKVPLWVVLKNHPKNILLAMGMRYAENGLYYLITVFPITYVISALKMGRQDLLPGMIMSSAVGLAALPFYGWLSDKIGRRVVYLWGATMCGILAFPLFWMLDKAPQNIVWGWAAIIIFMQVGHSAMYGPQASFLAELFPTKIRYTGASVGYQLAGVFAGGVSLPLATYMLIRSHNQSWPVALYIISFSVITIIATLIVKETYKKDIL
jgi:metabolite-proton symporter